MKQTAPLIFCLFISLAIASAEYSEAVSAEQDVCSRQGFYSCRLSLGCSYDGATATCKKIQPKPLNQEYDNCAHTGSYACSSIRGCQLNSQGRCQKIATSNESTSSTQQIALPVDNQQQEDDDLCSRLGFYACSSSRGCSIDPYTGRCAQIPRHLQKTQKQQLQEGFKSSSTAENDLCSNLGFYICSSDKGCWIDPYTGHCAQIPKHFQKLEVANKESDDHCTRLGSYACSSSRGCQLNSYGKCQKISNQQ